MKNASNSSLNLVSPLINIAVFSTIINILLLAHPLYLLQVFDRVMVTRSFDTLWMLTGLALGLIVAMIILDAGRKKLLLALSLNLDNLLASRLVSSYLKNGQRHDRSKANLDDLSALKHLLIHPAATAFFDAPWAIVFLTIIFFFHPLLGLFAITGITITIITALLAQKMTQRHADKSRESGEKADRELNQAVLENDLTQGLGMSHTILQRWQVNAYDTQIHKTTLEKDKGIFQAINKGMKLILQIGMICTATILVINEQASAGIMIGATILFGKMLLPIEQFFSNLSLYTKAIKSYKKLAQFHKTPEQESLAFREAEGKGKIEVRDLIVRSEDNGNILLRGFSFDLEPGEAIAVVGASGSGKTTLAKAITGSISPFTGQVLIDGSPVCAWAPQARNQVIGYLPQNTTLFSGTIAENIAQMRQPDEQRVIQAAKLAGIDAMIRDFPLGYNTVLSEKGYPLSMGEQQRIALARAVYCAPKIVVLDEPNASVDADGEKALYQCIQQLKQYGVTVFVTTHRPGVLTCVDKVAILRKGMVTNISTPENMMTAMRNIHDKPESREKPKDDTPSYPQSPQASASAIS